MTNPKVFVVDTNIILNDHTVPFSFKDAEVVLPQIVIQELDRKKDFENKTTAYNARTFCRNLKALLQEQNSTTLKLSSGGTLRILPNDPTTVQSTMHTLGLDPSKADSTIVAQTWLLHQTNPNTMLLTNDTNMWVTAVGLGLPVQDHEPTHPQKSQTYPGVATLRLEDTTLIEEVYSGRDIYLSQEEYPGLYPNQILVIKSKDSKQSSSLIAVFKGYKRPLQRVKKKKEQMDYCGISPLNKEQSFAYELLEDDAIACLSLAGRAGTGKSIVTLSFAIANLKKKHYEKIVILKPVVPVGKELGFLPGSLDEKLEPWVKSFRDVLDVIFKDEGGADKDDYNFKEKAYQYLIDSGMIEFQPLTFLRGRTLTNTVVILDEAQNCSNHELKTLVTRIGEGSKLIVLGDVDQIDVPYLDRHSNGLTHLIEKGKDSTIVAHITFIKSHRSGLAEWAAESL